MATTSAIEKNNYRRTLSNKHRAARKELRERSVNMRLSDEDRAAAFLKLQKMPRDGSPSRVVNRCRLTGRPRGNYRKFGLCRMVFRQLALNGMIPGVTKASW